MQNWNAWAKAFGRSFGVAWGGPEESPQVVHGVGHYGPVIFDDPTRPIKERMDKLKRQNNEAILLLLTT